MMLKNKSAISKITILTLALSALLTFGFARMAMAQPGKEWLSGKACHGMKVSSYTPATKDHAKSIDVQDTSLVSNFVSRLNKIPQTSGEEFKKFGDTVAIIDVTLTCDGKASTVSFYDGRLRMPQDGSFTGKFEKEQQALHKYISSFLE